MKLHSLLLPLLVFPPVAAQAQNGAAPMPKAAPQLAVDPAAQALLNKAVATYKAAKSIRFVVEVGRNGVVNSRVAVSYVRPNLLRTEEKNDAGTEVSVGDGANFYYEHAAIYKKYAADPEHQKNFLRFWTLGRAASYMATMLRGVNLVTYHREDKAPKDIETLTDSISFLPTRSVGGESLTGVRMLTTYRYIPMIGREPVISTESTLWFGGDATLRRVQVVHTGPVGDVTTIRERVTAQQLNPLFASETFKFDATGLTLAQEKKPVAEPPNFDARLHVGANPFPFSVRSLDGQTISPAKYKGKVLLLDFWATWCGPCVAGLPELQAAYAKYHAQGLEVVGISLDEDKTALTSFLKERKLTWPQVFDGGGWQSAVPEIYGVQAIPFLLVVGKDGRIAAVNPRGHIEQAVQAALAAK